MCFLKSNFIVRTKIDYPDNQSSYVPLSFFLFEIDSKLYSQNSYLIHKNDVWNVHFVFLCFLWLNYHLTICFAF